MARGRALCVKIVDAADFDATCIASSLRGVLGGSPVLLAVNKKDLVPRLDSHDLAFMRYTLEHRGLRCIGAHAVSAVTGDGVSELATAVTAAALGRNVIVCGAASVGKSTLINQLAQEVSLLSEKRDVASQRKAPLSAFEERVRQVNAEKRKRGTSEGTADPGSKTGFSLNLREVRDEAVGRLRLTESHMPGTTISAIAIPCLGSWSHAMYDTPGVVLAHSLAYSVRGPTFSKCRRS